MKKVLICFGLSLCLMFVGKNQTEALSIEQFQTYTYEKDQIMKVYQLIRQDSYWSDTLSKFVMLRGSDGSDYLMFLSTTIMNNPTRYLSCHENGCDVKFGIFSNLDDSSSSKRYHDVLTYAYHFSGNTVHQPSGWAFPDVGAEVVVYRLNSDFTLGQKNSFPYSGNMFFTFDENFKMYSNGTILFGLRSGYGKEYHGLLKGFKPGAQVGYNNLPKEDGTWTKPDEGISMWVDTSLIETESKPEGVEVCEWQEGDIFAVVKYIGCWLKNIWISIKNFFIDLFKLLFVPTKFQELVDQTAEKFSGFREIVNLKDKINIDADQQTTFIKFGGQELIDRSIFDQFMPIVHGIIISFSYFGFVVYLIREIPKVLEGIG